MAHRSLRTSAAAAATPPPVLQRHGYHPISTQWWNGSSSSSSGGVTTTDLPTTVTTIRYQHSSTQIKRLFRQHPARLRVEARMGIVRSRRRQPSNESHARLESETMDTDATPIKSLYQPLPDALQFAPIWTPVFLPNGWSAPPPPESDIAALVATSYPFQVRRTKNKPKDAVGFLPVYTKHRYVCTRVLVRAFCAVATKRKLYLVSLMFLGFVVLQQGWDQGGDAHQGGIGRYEHICVGIAHAVAHARTVKWIGRVRCDSHSDCEQHH
jgi:hypothetical protein